MNKKPVVGITIGDFNGIGPEIVIKSLRNKRILNVCDPVIISDMEV
ncbi:MAG TPA: 4-hydroxythreonine-4-phosphate dehydrogenase PdxA, partial [Candidatus Dadabacteria bacterium]|nr:4-hydroxythreonine-4-phosphate dehydrogenase PdxA [Candidatus Dadabacteria bacterium]